MPERTHRPVTVRMLVVSVFVGVVLAVASVPVGAVAPLPARWVQSGIVDIEEPLSVDHVRSLGRMSLVVHAGFYTGAHYDLIDPADDPRPPYAVMPATPGYVLRYEAAGWPWLAAQGRTLNWSTDESLVRVSLFADDRGIPLRPIWPGLLANTLFYATLTLALLAALRAWRTRRRRARGRCVACGYELGEGVAVCPECGLALRA